MTDRTPQESILKPIGVLSSLDSDELKQLSRFGQPVEVAPREKVISEGESRDCFYIVINGKLRVFRLATGFETNLAELSTGEPLGEMNFLDKQRASAHVQSIGGATLWRITREEFDRFTELHPHTANKLLHAISVIIVKRLRTAIRKISDRGQAVGEGWW